MIGAEEFGFDFQRILARACLDDPRLRGLVQRFTTAGQLGFTDPASAWAWQVIATSDKPTTLMLQTESGRLAFDDPARSGVNAILIAPDYREYDYVCEQVVEWARAQVFAMAFEESRELWNRKRKAEAQTAMMRRIEEMNEITIGKADRGWFFEDYFERQERREYVAEGMDCFPCGIDIIDRAMYGGLSYGEFEVPVAYSGIGKSYWCVQRGFVTSRSRRRCLHFVLEGGRAKTEDRYEARFAGLLYSDIRRGILEADVQTRLRREYDILKGNLVVRGYADRKAWRITMDDILTELHELYRTCGFIPDMIIVDYGDLVYAEGEDDRARQKNAYRQLKSLSEMAMRPGHLGFAVVAPSQAKRPEGGDDFKEHVLVPSKVADCYEKVRVADSIISLNRTIQEKKDGFARVFLGKYRDAEDGVLVKVKSDYKKGAFSVLGYDEERVEFKR